MKRETLAGIWVVGLAMLFLSFTLDWPWWGKQLEYSSSTGSSSLSYETTLIETSISKGSWELLLGYLVLLLLIVSFIAGLLFLVHLLALSRKKRPRKTDRMAIVTSLFLIFAIVIYAGVLPAAKFQDAKAAAIEKDGEFEEPGSPTPLKDFWGSSSDDTGDLSWGPGIGFFVACGAFCVLFITHILFAFQKPKVSKGV